MTAPTVPERVDHLERDVLQLARQCAELAHMCAQQSALLAGLLGKLGESADSVPGESPLGPERQRQGRKAN